MEPLLDTLGRPLETLRISITDRCNFRCVYCMPKEVYGRDHQFLERTELLSLEEIARVAGIFAALGVRTVRITGGEPLVRRNVEHLVELLHAIPGLEIALTTNGALLPQKAEALARAGLDRVTVSLDSVDDAAFRALNDVDFPVQKVLEGIDAAAAAGLRVKVNAVVKRGANDDGIVALAEQFRGTGSHAALHRVHGRRQHERLAPRRRRLERRDRRDDRRRPPARAGRGRPPRRDRAPLALPRRRRRDRRHRLRHEAVLRRLLARPPLGRGAPPHLPLRPKGHDLRAPLRLGASDEELAEILRGIWTPPNRPLFRAPDGRDLGPPEGRDVLHRGVRVSFSPSSLPTRIAS